MEGRARKYAGQASPERAKPRAEPPPLPPHQMRKIPVVYYLCRNRHLEHPHFIEVPLSSPEGMYLRDFINRLNELRGKGMPSMYSWSCKRSYKNGFVWHDLSEDDLVLPAHGNEYVLKGSELLDQSPSDWIQQTSSNAKFQNLKPHQQENHTSLRIQQASSSFSSPNTISKEAKPPPSPPTPREDDQSPLFRGPSSSSNNSPEPEASRPSSCETGSPGAAEYRVYLPVGAADASTQTEDSSGSNARGARNTCTRGISTDDSSADVETIGRRQNRTMRPKERSNKGENETCRPLTSSSASSSNGKTETLESLIRADCSKLNSFRIHEEEEVLFNVGPRTRATNFLMQLITCGSISIKDHRKFEFIPTYKPSFSHLKFPSPMLSSSMMVGELDCLSVNPRLVGIRIEDKEYFSGSLIETKKHNDVAAEMVPTLKRSSSYNGDRTCKSPDSKRKIENIVDSSRSKCLPRSIKIVSNRHQKNEVVKSPLSDSSRNSSAQLDCSRSLIGGSKRISEPSPVNGSSLRMESFKEEKEKLIKIEERLISGARVIIQSTAPCYDGEDSSDS